MRVIQKPPPKCIVRVGDTGSGIGYIEGYYKGGTFCMKSSGAYFTNAGLKESTECVTVAGGTGTTMRNRFADFLKDPNLKWYAAAAVAIAVLSLLSGRLIDRRKKQ